MVVCGCLWLVWLVCGFLYVCGVALWSVYGSLCRCVVPCVGVWFLVSVCGPLCLCVVLCVCVWVWCGFFVVLGGFVLLGVMICEGFFVLA